MNEQLQVKEFTEQYYGERYPVLKMLGELAVIVYNKIGNINIINGVQDGADKLN